MMRRSAVEPREKAMPSPTVDQAGLQPNIARTWRSVMRSIQLALLSFSIHLCPQSTMMHLARLGLSKCGSHPYPNQMLKAPGV